MIDDNIIKKNARPYKDGRWHATDSEELFNENTQDPIARAKLGAGNWTKDSIEYKFNSEGYRSDEFVKNGILCLGCSLTEGVGLPFEQTWPYLIGQELNLPVCNLGTSAATPDTAFRTALYWIPKLQPRYVFYLIPPTSRREFIDLNGDIHYTGIHRKKNIHPLEVQHSSADELNSLKNSMAIKMLCAETLQSIDYYTLDHFWPFLHGFSNDSTLARDLIHYGPGHMKSIKSKFIYDVKKRRAP